MLTLIKNAIEEGEECILLSDNVTFENVLDAYTKGDKLCVNVVDGFLKVIAKVLRSIVELLDLDNIIIGPDVDFGALLVNKVEIELNKNRKGIFVPIYVATMKDSESGAIMYAIEQAIDYLVESDK